jgi:hypothetical protein
MVGNRLIALQLVVKDEDQSQISFKVSKQVQIEHISHIHVGGCFIVSRTCLIIAVP